MEMKTHPAAEVFPMIGKEELTALANDIVQNGQVHPCITWNGILIDGRNRIAACKIAGVEPRFEERQFASDGAVIDFIISTNERRRHLNPSQRAMIAAELTKIGSASLHKDEKHEGEPAKPEPKPISSEKAAKVMGVSRRSVESAKKVQTQAPALAGKVKAGEMSVSAAADLADAPTAVNAVAAGDKPADQAVAEVRAAKAPPKVEPKELEALRKENEALQKQAEEYRIQIEQLGADLESAVSDLKSLQEIVDAKDGLKKAAELEKKARQREESMKRQHAAAIQGKSEAVALLKKEQIKVKNMETKLAKLQGK